MKEKTTEALANDLASAFIGFSVYTSKEDNSLVFMDIDISDITRDMAKTVLEIAAFHEFKVTHFQKPDLLKYKHEKGREYDGPESRYMFYKF